MNLRRNPRHRHSARCLTASAMTLLIPFAIGCASPGNPRPPTLNLAEVVTDLTAQRIGNQVQLHWTTPSRTTDGLNLKGPLTAEFCRQPSPPRSPPPNRTTSNCQPQTTPAAPSTPPPRTARPTPTLPSASAPSNSTATPSSCAAPNPLP